MSSWAWCLLQGTDTLNCLVEGFRFAMAAHSDALETW